MNSKNVISLNVELSERTFSILDLRDLSLRAGAAEEVSDNARRINLAASVLLSFAEQTGIGNSTEPAETAVTDLLTDLMHLYAYCWPDECSVSFESIIDTARMHFLAESEDVAPWD